MQQGIYCGDYKFIITVYSQVSINSIARNNYNIVFQYHNYKLILTGHSLGAGVAAVLAVLYHSRYRHLHCYAFSPPGSLFTLPLVEYSKSFITTIIYGNDIVPRCSIYLNHIFFTSKFVNFVNLCRLTFRGLLYLKKNLTHLLMHCKLPKVS